MATSTRSSKSLTTPAKKAPAKKAPVRTAATKPPARVASVPKPMNDYVNRMVRPYVNDFMLFDFAFDHKRNLMIEGPTGCGKTSAIVAWAADRKLPFFSVSSNVGVEPSQLFGKYVPTDVKDEIKWQDGPVTDIVRHGGVLLLNEINFIPERVATVLFSLLDERRQIQLLDKDGEVITGHNDLVVFADYNPDYAGTREMNLALKNRFPIQLKWDYDPAIEEKLIESAALRDVASKIRAKLGQEFETPVSTNMLQEFEQHWQYFGQEFAREVFVNHFGLDEQASIKQIVNTAHDNIERELAKAMTRLTPMGDPFVNEDGAFGENWTYTYEGDEA